MASNNSPDNTTTLSTLPTAAMDNPGVDSFYRRLPSGPLEGVPESAAQRVPDLVVQQEVDRQRRTLQQPGLQVRRHARLAGEHRLQPQGRSVPGHRTTELLALLVRGLYRLGQADAGGAVLGLVGRRRGRIHRRAHHRLRAAVGGAARRALVLALNAVLGLAGRGADGRQAAKLAGKLLAGRGLSGVRARARRGLGGVLRYLRWGCRGALE